MLRPSHFARPSPALEDLAREFGVDNRNGGDPLQLLTTINTRLYRKLRLRQTKHVRRFADRGRSPARGKACARILRTS